MREHSELAWVRSGEFKPVVHTYCVKTEGKTLNINASRCSIEDGRLNLYKDGGVVGSFSEWDSCISGSPESISRAVGDV